MFGALFGGEDRSSEPATRIEVRALETLRRLDAVAAQAVGSERDTVLRMAVVPEGR